MRGNTHMRLLSLAIPVAAAVSTVAAGVFTDARPSERSRPVVILVHGRGQLGFDSAASRREWKRDLDSSLALVGMPKLRDEDVRVAWYADVLDPHSADECAFTSEAETVEMGFGSLARGFLATLTSVLSDSVESFGFRGIMGDVLYFVDRGTRCAAEQRVARSIETAVAELRPVIVVAYSLGSLVTYEYLSRTAGFERSADLRLVTIGSPLGVREIRELLTDQTTDSLRVPAAVKSWENVYDPDDVFSAPLHGKVAAPGILDRRIESASDENAHYIGRYLRDRSTGAAVGRALCATAKDQLGRVCSRV